MFLLLTAAIDNVLAIGLRAKAPLLL